MRTLAVTIVAGYAILVVVQFVLYSLMVKKLKTRISSVQFVRIAWSTPVSENFSIYDLEFHNNRNAMRLWWCAKITRLATFLLFPIVLGVILVAG